MSKKKREDAWDSNGHQDWGSYMAAKKSKLEDQFHQLAQAEFQEATNLFKGVAIFVNGYTNPCADILKRLMMEHGGIYHTYQHSNSTTHLIASNLPYSKIVQYRKSKNSLPLCKPEWITDSIKANKLLDWRPYLLYNSTSITQPRLQLAHKPKPSKEDADLPEISEIKEDATISTEPQDLPEESSASVNHKNRQEKSTKTQEIHSKPSGTTLCSKDEKFLSEFYKKSRLHHIATMAATFKEYINEIRTKHDGSFAGFTRLKALIEKNANPLPKDQDQGQDSDSGNELFSQRCSKDQKKKEFVIMHIDMDCFFVSVGLRNKPELRGQPVAVTHAKGTKPLVRGNKEYDDFCSMSEIASCSYEARKAGLKNGMFLGQALKLCPNLKTIEYDFEGYKEVSSTLYDTVASYTLDIEAVSCDEMYADISKILHECNLKPTKFATIIRDEIKEKTGCPVSTGFGSNKLLARLATKKSKPDGQFHLKSEDVELYIGEIGIGEIPGVGWSTMHQLRKMNVELCRDLQQITLGVLQEKFGKKNGEMLFNTCRGIDHSKLSTDHVRKSVSAEVNYGIRFQDDNDARGFLTKLTKEVCGRLMKCNCRGRCVTLKLMVRAKNAPIDPPKFMGHGLCDNFTKSKNFMTPVDDEGIITKDILLLWEQMRQSAHEIRGIGIQISRLENLKTKAVTNNLMKFITREKIGENAVEHPKDIKKMRNSENQFFFYETNKNIESKKLQDLKTFLAKKLSIEHPQKSLHTGENLKIDKSVSAAFPEDIRLEILKMHNQDTHFTKRSTFVTSHSEKFNTQFMENANSSEEKLSTPFEVIDEDVLVELPKDIRKEILASKPTVKKSPPNGINNYFKHKKLGSYSKPKMPSMQELDMQVLIELPDDIRNEILNEYREHKNESFVEMKNPRRNLPLDNSERHVETAKKSIDDMNCSFSQVDPEFLAALDTETRNDVKAYYFGKKNGRESKLKTNVIEKLQNINNAKPKKRGRKPKALAVATKNSKDTVFVKKTSSKRDCDQPETMKMNKSFLQYEMSILDDGSSNNGGAEKIRFCFNNSCNPINHLRTEQQKMLNTLVNYLFSLPLQQVKKQIQTWINNSDNVNEIDSLSITIYLSLLPKEKRIEDLHTLMKTIHRCMTETGSCVWHGTYRKTVEHVQQCMQIEYNSNLILPAIRCNLRKCKVIVYDNV